MIECPYCSKNADLVSGKEIYTHRPDLYDLKFWRCEPCDAYVGCHKPGSGFGDGTRPLGRLANRELRTLKSAAHEAFDPIWKSGLIGRKKAYMWLSKKLGIPFDRTHIGEFDEDTCKRAIEACMGYRKTFKSAVRTKRCSVV